MLDAISVCLCLMFITLLITFYFIRTFRQNSLDLPGPTGLPIIGCFNQLDKENIHHTMDKWAYEYGEMFCVSLFGEPWLVINTSELAREVYLEEATANVTSGRKPTFVSTYIMDDSNISLSSMSDQWKHRRKVAHRLLRAYGEGLRQIEGILNMLLKKMSKRLSQSVDVTINPTEIVNDFLLETLEILITGRNDNRELRTIMKELDDIFNTEIVHPGKNMILSILPWIRFLPCEVARNIQTFFNIRQQLFNILDAFVSKNQDAIGIYKQLLNVLEEENKADKKNRITMKNVQMIVIDFINAGVWQAVRDVFPNVTLKGCAFHWTKAVWTHIQNLGLVTTFREREASHLFMKQLMALPFLPWTHITDVFSALRERCPPHLQQLVQYINNQWMTNPTFPIRSWSVYDFTVRTNNDVEGHLTTRGTLLSIIKILISRKDVQTKVQNEIDRIIGRDRSPCLSDREDCPFTEATILETFRYISHVPFTPHQAMDDFYLHGIKVPQGCSIYANIWHMHHKEEEWTDPFAFRPERFLDENDKLLPATDPVRKRLLSFGVGKRSCIGEVFAKSRIFLFVTTLLQQYNITSPNNEEVPLFNPKDMTPGIVLTPTEFKCKIILR